MTKTFLICIYGILTLLLVNSVQPLLTVGSDAETVILAENDTDSEEDTKKSLDDVYLSENFMRISPVRTIWSSPLRFQYAPAL